MNPSIFFVFQVNFSPHDSTILSFVDCTHKIILLTYRPYSLLFKLTFGRLCFIQNPVGDCRCKKIRGLCESNHMILATSAKHRPTNTQMKEPTHRGAITIDRVV